jgi:hypothetical protein
MSDSGVQPFPPGVDWNFLAAREGAMLNGSVPRDANGNPDADSGVTIAVGFDLGGGPWQTCRREDSMRIWSRS